MGRRQSALTGLLYHDNVSHEMRTTTIRQLRHDTATVLSWVAQGERVEVRRRNERVAVLSPPSRRAWIDRPDFKARLRAIYGTNTLAVSGTALISESRGDS